MTTDLLDKALNAKIMRSVYDPAHFLLNTGIEDEAGPNIGRNGANLTISFLSLGRVHLSEKLCRSINSLIPNFAGEILIVDNGSSNVEVEKLSKTLDEMRFSSRLIQLGKNLGVAGGRNKAAEYVRTEWMMCLDNDIYFIDNPLPRLQQDIGVTGCHFMSMPLMDPDKSGLFALGGHLYLQADKGGNVWLGAGSAYQQHNAGLLDEKVFLGTFLFGGSSILNVESFKRLGGYDEAMFIGFEDIDFSIRIFRAGMKVGCSGFTALVHDHPPAQTSGDANYERTRFSRQIIERSAKHLQEKYGFSIWSENVEQWLKNQTEKMTGVQTELSSASPALIPSRSPASRLRIALVVDSDDWAFANISKQIAKNLGHKYDFEIIPHTYFDNYFQLTAVLSEFDFVHIFWREVILALDTPYNASYASQLGQDLTSILERFFKGRPVTTAVYDHLFLNEADAKMRAPLFKSVTGYTVSSNRLQKIYSELADYPPPAFMFPDGVDLETFVPRQLGRFKSMDRPIVIGWVGNSNWNGKESDIKGVHTILKPAIAQLQAEGLDIIANFADRQERFIPHDEMPAYYQGIDVCICVSEIEGTPNPVLEAMASGVPVISTDVGLVPDVFGPKQRQFILSKRTVEALKEAIQRLYKDRRLFGELSEENLASIQAWDWRKIAPKFEDFITLMLKRHRERHPI